MATKTIELDYTPELNRKIIHKAGVPGDNLPDNLMQFMCKHYDNNNIIEGKRILVIRMLDLAKQYAVKNSVTYITDNPEKYDEFLKAINNEQKYGCDDSVELIEDWKNIGELLKDMPKFDVAIMNPPYDGNLHLKILEKVIQNADKVVNISPSNCYTCNRLKFSTDIPMYDKFVKTIFSHCTSVDPISASLASKIFNIGQGTDIAISVYDNTYTDKNYVADKFLKYDNKKLDKSICDKILKKCQDSHWETFKGEGDYILNTSHVHGHPGNKDFTNLLCMKYEDALKVKKTPDVRSCQFKFKTEEERKNFYNAYMNSKVIHWWNYQWKNQIILVLKYIPYLQDYTQPWTDKRFCEYFSITGYIDDEHAEPNSEWEMILNTMKDFK